jgi:hypothetical protein
MALARWRASGGVALTGMAKSNRYGSILGNAGQRGVALADVELCWAVSRQRGAAPTSKDQENLYKWRIKRSKREKNIILSK